MKTRIKLGQLPFCATILSFSILVSGFAADSGERIVNPAKFIASLQPPPKDMNGDKVFAGLVEHSRLRDKLLEQYSVRRTYKVGDTKGKTCAKEVVEVRFRTPDKKTFTKKSEDGSWLVRHLVLDQLISSEEQTSSGRDHHDSSITPRNYSFELLGEEQVGPYACYVVKVTPSRTDKYLFRGWMWISKEDFGIVRIVGSPAKKISFWVERVDFVRQYQKIGIFWLPTKDETTADIRWKGTMLLTIAHADYAVNGFPSGSATALIPSGDEQKVKPQFEILTPAISQAASRKIVAAHADENGEIK
jgi:hypothetical protein